MTALDLIERMDTYSVIIIHLPNRQVEFDEFDYYSLAGDKHDMLEAFESMLSSTIALSIGYRQRTTMSLGYESDRFIIDCILQDVNKLQPLQ